jgi:glutamine phosphoribosylpyrophosphate amidotransferase
MCSVIGFKGTYNKNLLDKIYKESRIRGIHAFGFSHYNNGILETQKFLNFDTFVNKLHELAPSLFIAHFRYSTSGDFNVMENNQPINFEDKSIVFNGVISQKNKTEIEKEFGVKMDIDNDGYVLIQKFKHKTFVLKDDITFSMIGLDNGKLIALRNKKRPLYFNEDSNVIICSTRDIMKRSGIEFQKEVTSLKLYEW